MDLGLAAKVRPALVLSVPPGEGDRALATLVPHTTSLRGSRFEVVCPVRFLPAGGFDAQSIVTVPLAKLVRPLGVLPQAELRRVEDGVYDWLGLRKPSP